jgi:hypothetical protein
MTVSPQVPTPAPFEEQVRAGLNQILENYGLSSARIDLRWHALSEDMLIWNNRTRKYLAVFFDDTVVSDNLSNADLELLFNTARESGINLIVSEPSARTCPYLGVNTQGEVVLNSSSNLLLHFAQQYAPYEDGQYEVKGLSMRSLSVVQDEATVLISISNSSVSFPLLTFRSYGVQGVGGYAIASALHRIPLSDDTGFISHPSSLFASTIAAALAIDASTNHLGRDTRYASIVADDFSLDKYEYPNFAKYAEALQVTGAAGDIAFEGHVLDHPPGMYDKSIALARASPNLEILNHGVINNCKEFNGTYDEVLSNVSSAMQHMERMSQLTGLPYAHLIVPPCGAFGEWTLRAFQAAGMSGGIISFGITTRVTHRDPFANVEIDMPILARTLIGYENGTWPRTTLTRTRLALAEYLFRFPILVYCHPWDFADGNAWLIDFVRYTQQLGYTWVTVSQVFDLTSNLPLFALSNPGAMTLTQGATNSTSINVLGDIPQSVSLSCSGLPSGASCSFTPRSGHPTFTSVLAVTASSSTPTGSFTITVTGNGEGSSRTTSFTLTVSSPFDFSIVATPGSLSVDQGSLNYYSIAVNSSSLRGQAQSVSLMVVDCPSGATCSFSPASVLLLSYSPSSYSTLIVDALTSTASGTYTLTIVGSGGGSTHSVQVSLTVTENPWHRLSMVLGGFSIVVVGAALALVHRARRKSSQARPTEPFPHS